MNEGVDRASRRKPAGTTACSHAEHGASDARVLAAVPRIEALDKAVDVLTRRVAAQPKQAGRGAELEEQQAWLEVGSTAPCRGCWPWSEKEAAP